ncbi:hypothetical protein RND71_034874 [Anisodus tanguticus]|uniref:Uncharacterized protein n=1 Tax=Anisodus tanguticus TaxID=243964 RepID=A0AAE1R411_9SOLA|nr:hypothetical protein RND71_034874 [Anisodus tanguticus]
MKQIVLICWINARSTRVLPRIPAAELEEVVGLALSGKWRRKQRGTATAAHPLHPLRARGGLGWVAGHRIRDEEFWVGS